MTKYLYHAGELERLNGFCANKIIDRIDIDHGDSITIFFEDGSYAVLSTLGGVSIESLHPMDEYANTIPSQESGK